MEEVDAIILQSLREIGCDIDSDAKLKTLTPEEIFKSLKNLCKSIQPDVDIPNHLPAQMAQRFSAASQIVDCCKSLGFQGDLGYQTILYSNVIELRRIFMWLIEHLPKSEDKTDTGLSTNESKSKLIANKISAKLRVEMKQPWVIEFLQSSQKSANPTFLEVPNDQLVKNPAYPVPIYRQTSKNLLSSLVITHDRGLYESLLEVPPDSVQMFHSLRDAMTHSVPSVHLSPSPSKPVGISSENSEHVSKPRTKLEILTDKIEDLRKNIENQEELHRNLQSEKNNQVIMMDEKKEDIEKAKKDEKLKNQIVILLQNPEESKQKLIESLETMKRKRENLNAKFETHKMPLDEKIKSFSGVNSVKLKKSQEKIKDIDSMRKMIAEVKEDIKAKIAVQKNFHEELSQMKRVTERSSYTSRIMDIVKNIKRQNKDIDEILKDTKTVQKAINTAEGQLQRQFTVTEDLIWNNTSKQDEYSKKAYKLLISLHTEFGELISLIENTGSIQREIRDIEDQIDHERQLNIAEKLDQITKDLEVLVKCRQ